MMRMTFFSALVFSILVIGIHAVTNKEAMDYLWDYQHLSNRNPRPKEYSEGLKHFQRFAQIPVTGVLDSATKDMMKTPRCFNPDNNWMDGENRIKRYTIFGSKWLIKNVSYHIEYPDTVDRSVIDDGLKQAFEMWTSYSGINFRKSPRINAHIKMKFDHIEPVSTLGYAYQPPVGIIRFNNHYAWTKDTIYGQNFYQTALHEIGHALGLKHSQLRQAVMFAFSHPYDPNYRLHADDIAGIQDIYDTKN